MLKGSLGLLSLPPACRTVSEVVTNPVVITLATVAFATNLAIEANPGARKTIENTMQVCGREGTH
jgi:hypothetical protein